MGGGGRRRRCGGRWVGGREGEGGAGGVWRATGGAHGGGSGGIVMGGWGGRGLRSVGPRFSRVPEWWVQRKIEGGAAEAGRLGVEGG